MEIPQEILTAIKYFFFGGVLATLAVLAFGYYCLIKEEKERKVK